MMENKNIVIEGAIITPEIIKHIRELQGGYISGTATPQYLNEDLQTDLKRIGDNIEFLIGLRTYRGAEEIEAAMLVVDTLNEYRRLLKGLEAPLGMFDNTDNNKISNNY